MTNIGVSSLLGADMTTFFAPAAMWPAAFSFVRNRPVDSTIYSAPSLPHFRFAGSLSLNTGMTWPLTTSAFSRLSMSALQRPCIVLEHIGKVIGRAQIVDADHVDLGMLEAGTEHHTADTAKAVDTDFNRHKMRSLSFLRNISNVWHIWYYSILFFKCKCFFKKFSFTRKFLYFRQEFGILLIISHCTLRSSRCGTFFHTKIAPSCKGYEQLSQRRRTL